MRNPSIPELNCSAIDPHFSGYVVFNNGIKVPFRGEYSKDVKSAVIRFDFSGLPKNHAYWIKQIDGYTENDIKLLSGNNVVKINNPPLSGKPFQKLTLWWNPPYGLFASGDAKYTQAAKIKCNSDNDDNLIHNCTKPNIKVTLKKFNVTLQWNGKSLGDVLTSYASLDKLIKCVTEIEYTVDYCPSDWHVEAYLGRYKLNKNKVTLVELMSIEKAMNYKPQMLTFHALKNYLDDKEPLGSKCPNFYILDSYTPSVDIAIPKLTATQILHNKAYDCSTGSYIKTDGTALFEVFYSNKTYEFFLVPPTAQPFVLPKNAIGCIVYGWKNGLVTLANVAASSSSCKDVSGSLSFSRQKDELKVTAKTNGQMTLKVSVKDKTGMHPIGKWKVVNMLTIPVQLSSFVTPLTVYALLGFETPDGFKAYTSKKITVENFKSNATPKVVNYTISPKTVHKGDPVTLTIQMSEKTSYNVTVYLIPTDAAAKASIKNMQTVSFNGEQAIKFPTKSYNSSTLVYTFNAPGLGEYDGYVIIEVK